MPSLRFAAYCGMSHEIEEGDMQELRARAARYLKRRRNQDYPVTTLKSGEEWEIMEPDDCAMVPDTCGILFIQPDPETDYDEEGDDSDWFDDAEEGE